MANNGNKVLNWFKDHVRAYVRIKSTPEEMEYSQNPKEEKENLNEKIEDLEKKTEVGFEFRWKF